MITIDSNGAVSFSGGSERRVMSGQAGKWRIGAAGSGVIVLESDALGGRKNALRMAGALSDGFAASLLDTVASWRLSGALVTTAESVRRELFFDRGVLRMATSTAHGDLLGEFLVNEGAVTRAQLQQALEGQASGKKLGEVLIEQGVLSAPDVFRLLMRKIEKIFIDVVELEEGVYYFLDGVDLSKLPAALYFDTQGLLVRAAAFSDQQQYCRRTFPRLTALARSDLKALHECDDSQKRFLELVDGRRNLSAIGQALGLRLEQAIKAMNALGDMGLVEAAREAEAEPEAALGQAIESFNAALAAIYAAVGNMRDTVRAGQDYLRRGSHDNRFLREVVLQPNGMLEQENIRSIMASASESDKLKLAVVVLTQFVSFMLFSVGGTMDREQEQKLSARVNQALSGLFSASL